MHQTEHTTASRAIIDAKLTEVLDLVELSPKIPVRTHSHSEELKAVAIAMRATGLTYQKIADTLKVGTGSVHAWVNEVSSGDVVTNELAEKVKSQLANKAYLMANSVLSAVTDEDVKGASLLQKGTFSAIMIDKARLMDGQSTQNISQMHHRVEALADKNVNMVDDARSAEADIAALEAEIESLS